MASISEVTLQRYGPVIMEQFAKAVCDKLVETWIEEHGAELMKSLTADAIKAQVQKKIEDQVAKILLSPTITYDSR